MFSPQSAHARLNQRFQSKTDIEKSYGSRTYHSTEIASCHTLETLPAPQTLHEFPEATKVLFFNGDASQDISSAH